MVTITKKLLGAILATVFTLASGVTYYIVETGKYSNCSGGWILNELTGKYGCPTRNVESQWCHHGSEEGPENIGYRCYIGIPIESVTTTTISSSGAQKWDCDQIGCVACEQENNQGKCVRIEWLDERI